MFGLTFLRDRILLRLGIRKQSDVLTDDHEGQKE